MQKTLGLAQIMAQSGLPILADQVVVGIFSRSLQILEMNNRADLSTFSVIGDQYRIYLESWIPPPWILLDELRLEPILRGAGLAIAILEDLRLRGIKTMATTPIQSSRPTELRLQECKCQYGI